MWLVFHLQAFGACGLSPELHRSGHGHGRGRRSEADRGEGSVVNEGSTGCFDLERWRAERFCRMSENGDISALLDPLLARGKSCLSVFAQCVPFVAAIIMQCNNAYFVRKIVVQHPLQQGKCYFSYHTNG